MSQSELGSRAFCSGTYIGLFEAGERRPQLELSRTLDELLGSGEHLQRILARNPGCSRPGGIASRGCDAERRGVVTGGVGEIESARSVGTAGPAEPDVKAQPGRFWFSMYSLITLSGAPPAEAAK
ncbi:helix-turn-helix domain-containing protein [Streptomyces sp. NBC_00464]|uniref:helix-turn-helix domain-containing protein n=1 Tax=Streptomyces sp. NBC_00464 TaxID=2975751 RepID=UPI003FA75945